MFKEVGGDSGRARGGQRAGDNLIGRPNSVVRKGAGASAIGAIGQRRAEAEVQVLLLLVGMVVLVKVEMVVGRLESAREGITLMQRRMVIMQMMWVLLVVGMGKKERRGMMVVVLLVC